MYHIHLNFHRFSTMSLVIVKNMFEISDFDRAIQERDANKSKLDKMVADAAAKAKDKAKDEPEIRMTPQQVFQAVEKGESLLDWAAKCKFNGTPRYWGQLL